MAISPERRNAAGPPLFGDPIYIDGGDGSAIVRAVDQTVAVHGPFSEDFRWVTLKGGRGPIQLSDSQLALLRLLWELAGKAIKGDQLMRKLGSGSDRPMDLVKLKKGQKDRPEYEGPLFAYRKLIVATRGGDYSIPRVLPTN